MKSILKLCYISILVFTLSFEIQAKAGSSGLSIPRFVSLKSNKVNVRVGPEKRYPIRWVYTSKYEPVEVVAEYDHWRKIRDVNNEGGWVHRSLLSGKRFIVINKNKTALYKYSKISNQIIAYLGKNLRCRLESCTGDFCKISYDNKLGWVAKTDIWGVYKYD